MFSESDADRFYALEKQVFAGVAVARAVQPFTRSDGTPGWVDNCKYPVHGPDGQIAGLFGIARDVTDFKNATFNDAPVGQILSSRAEGVVAQFKGPQDSVIQDTVFGGVISEINAGQISDIDTAWARVKALLEENDIS